MLEISEIELKNRQLLIKKLQELREFNLIDFLILEKRKALISLIDKLLRDLPKAPYFPLRVQARDMINLIDKFLTNTIPFKVIRDSPNLMQELDSYYHNLQAQDIWESSDKGFEDLVRSPREFKAKEKGVKMSGVRTGVYTFQDASKKEKMLIKQGGNVGETIAEFIGGNLYTLTLPDNAAKCLLMKDKSSPSPTINDVYVASLYEKAETQDAYKAAGYKSRPFFEGLVARFNKFFGIKDCLIRKLIKIDEEKANHSLSKCLASGLWHGDPDLHTENLLHLKEGDKEKFFKIDHGHSFFDFNKDVPNIHSLFGSKIFDISITRALKKEGPLIKFYPINRFWDYAVESKRFYYNPTFIAACQEIASLSPLQIQDNLHASLQSVLRIYDPNAAQALRSFGKRIGMTSKEIDGGDAEGIAVKIEGYMTQRLKERQASMAKLANYCLKQAGSLDKEHVKISAQLGDQIIHLLDRQLELMQKKPQTNSSKNEKRAIEEEINFLKMLQQFNDSGLLKTTTDHKIVLEREYFFQHQGCRQQLTPEDFDQKMSKVFDQKMSVIFSRETFKDQMKNEKYPFEGKIPLSDKSIELVQLIRRIGHEPKKPRINP